MHTVEEGAVSIRVPEQTKGAGEGVFYNPEQELNRDLTVAVLRRYREQDGVESYLDAMTASGIRAVRAAAADFDVTALDVRQDAVDLARENVAANDLTATIRRRDANVDLHQQRYDVVDIDPFGTPIPFADAAFHGTQDLLCVTATDTAPLCGAHFEPGIRRYSTVPRNTEYHAEMGVRVLLSALARTGARYDVGISPCFAHATRHYVRVYLELERSASDANSAIDTLGYVHHCQTCLHREADYGLIADPPDSCPGCEGEQVITAGPIWLGRTSDPDIVADIEGCVTEDLGTAMQVRRLLETIKGELDTPTHYDQHRLCKRWNRSAGPMDEFLDALRDAGYPASRTHFGGTTVKTEADVATIREVTA